MRIMNVHERVIPASEAAIGALIDTLASDPGDRLWPWERWPAQILDRGLTPGSAGGHGPIRYHVIAHDPGRRVRYAFDRIFGAPVRGHHGFDVVPGDAPGESTLRHVMLLDVPPRVTLLWRLGVHAMHDAFLEDALDKAERELTGAVRRPARHSAWVRALRRAFRPRRPA